MAAMLTQKAHMPQHMAPSGLSPSQCAQDSSRRVLFGLTDISRIHGTGCRKLSVLVLPACTPVGNFYFCQGFSIKHNVEQSKR